MKFAIVVFAIVAAASAQQVRPNLYNPYPYNQYNQYQQYNPYNPFQRNQYPYNRYNQYNQYSTPAPFRAFSTVAPALEPSSIASPTALPPVAPVPVSVPRVANIDARNANIVRLENEIGPDGSYNYIYETDNGIAAQEVGVPRVFNTNPPVAPIVAQGSYSYTSPEGIPVAVSYTADENGFHPVGNVLPTSPPIPELIARSLEFNARNAPATSLISK